MIRFRSNFRATILVITVLPILSPALLLAQAAPARPSPFRPDQMDTILYGAAYYPEYMPYERTDTEYSSDARMVPYAYPSGSNLLTQGPVVRDQSIPLQPWDVAIVKEK